VLKKNTKIQTIWKDWVKVQMEIQ